MLALILATGAACAHSEQPSANTEWPAVAQTAERQQIIELLQRYQQAMRTADIEGIAATLHEDVVTTFQGKLTARGKVAVLKSYQATFQAMDFTQIEYLVDEIDVSNGLAVLSTYHPVDSFVTNKQNQQKIMDHNRELFVLKEVAGQWLIVRYMYNQTPEQAK